MQIKMKESNPSLEMRADNTVRELRRGGDIEDYLDTMERTMVVAKQMLAHEMIPQERFNKFEKNYMEVLVYYINRHEAPPIGYKPPMKIEDIDLSE